MEQTLSRQNQRQHIVWLDVVRLVAMFTVVCCHSADPFNFYPGTSPDIANIKFWGAIYGAILRPCVWSLRRSAPHRASHQRRYIAAAAPASEHEVRQEPASDSASAYAAM